VEIEVLRKFSGNTNITSFYGVYGIKVSTAQKASRSVPLSLLCRATHRLLHHKPLGHGLPAATCHAVIHPLVFACARSHSSPHACTQTPGTAEDKLWLAMEYCGGGSVTDLAKKMEPKRIPELVMRYVLRDTLRAIVYLHQNGIVHRDIKGQNILMTNEASIRLIDFGVSAEMKLGQKKRSTFIGTPCVTHPMLANSAGGCKAPHARERMVAKGKDVWLQSAARSKEEGCKALHALGRVVTSGLGVTCHAVPALSCPSVGDVVCCSHVDTCTAHSTTRCRTLPDPVVMWTRAQHTHSSTRCTHPHPHLDSALCDSSDIHKLLLASQHAHTHNTVNRFETQVLDGPRGDCDRPAVGRVVRPAE
jgi:hypothetical protein